MNYSPNFFLKSYQETVPSFNKNSNWFPVLNVVDNKNINTNREES